MTTQDTSPPSQMTLGTLLQHYRAAVSLTQEELAERAGMSVRGLSDLERGTRSRPYQNTVRRLADALELSSEDRVIFEAAARGASVTPAGVHRSGRHNLPASLTSFIGREREIAEISRLLARVPDTGGDRCRGLTIAGPPGCGKTRLALETARYLVDQYPDGVWLVEFASLAETALVPQAVARVLNIGEESDVPMPEALADALKSRTMLLVLDNCEHLLDAVALLVETLLRRCPDLRVLATSREALRIPGEMMRILGPLAVPHSEEQPPEDLMELESVHLFLDRVRYRLPDFALTQASAPSVARICSRLEGVPLAIELAAARVPALSVEQIAQRLDRSLDLLTTGSRTADPRQHTLRGALTWSYDLLDEEERDLFTRLSVFAGGWNLEAAVAAGETPDTGPERVQDLLAQLVDKSLVTRQNPPKGDRYRFLEPVRQYAAELLWAGEVYDAAHRRHAALFLDLAEEAERHQGGLDQGVWLDRLETEHGNLRAALEWCRSDEEDRELGLRLAGSLWRFWYVRGYLQEGRTWLEVMLAAAGDVSEAARARATRGMGGMAYGQRQYAEASLCFEKALDIYRELDDRAGVAACLNNLAAIADEQGEIDGARTLHEEALAIRRALGDTAGISQSIGNLGALAHFRGQYEEARRLYEEGLELERKLGDTGGAAVTLNNLGELATRQGDVERAEALFSEGLELAAGVGEKEAAICCLEGLGHTEFLRGHLPRSARLHGAAAGLRAAIGAPIRPGEQPEHERHMEEVRGTLGEPTFRMAWDDGLAMALERAVEYALQDDESGGARIRDALLDRAR